MLKKVLLLTLSLNVVIISIVLFTKSISAEYLNYFSPKDDVNFNIARAINGCSRSIDLAIPDIESGKIAEALIAARRKGVNIRILFTKKYPGRNSQIKNILSNNIQAWMLDDQNVHIGNFAIFDKKLLLGGSFSFDGDKYQNVTFTNDAGLLQQYQNRFESFSNLKLTEATSTFQSSSSPAENSSWDNEGSGSTGSTQTSGEQSNLSFDEMNKLFGKHSTLSNSEKKHEWEKYKNKTVTWTGNISYVAWGLITGDIIGVVHGGEEEVTVNINSGYEMHVKKMHKGDSVTYRGRLVNRPKRFSGFKIKDAEILMR